MSEFLINDYKNGRWLGFAQICALPETGQNLRNFTVIEKNKFKLVERNAKRQP